MILLPVPTEVMVEVKSPKPSIDRIADSSNLEAKAYDFYDVLYDVHLLISDSFTFNNFANSDFTDPTFLVFKSLSSTDFILTLFLIV